MVKLVEFLGLQLRLQRVEGRHLVAHSGDAQTLHLEGILPTPHVEVKFALRLHLEAVHGRLALTERRTVTVVAITHVEGEEHAGNRRVRVLQREVAVS